MDKTIKLWLNILMFIFLILLLAFTIAYNLDSKDILLGLSSVLIASVSIRYLMIYEVSTLYRFGIASIAADAVIVFIISGIEKYGISKLYYLVLICDGIIFYPVCYGILISAGCSLLLIVKSYLSGELNSLKEFGPYFFNSLILILFIVVIMSIVKYVINQHTRLAKTLSELETAHAQLKETAVQLEQMVLLKERNRIAAEVHDTIGHTLTTVLVEIEAGKRVMARNPEEAADKLELALEQVRKGLNDINQSIKAIRKEAHPSENIRTSIEKIILETTRHTNVTITSSLHGLDTVPEKIRKILIKAFKEGITNGIRHGRADSFQLSLCITDDIVEFSLEDNGCGFTSLEYGFGLNTIRESVEGISGSVQLISEEAKGCTLKISCPVSRNALIS